MNVVAHQVKLVMAVTVGRVNGKFGWGKGEDRPTAAGINRCHTKDVREECPDLLSLPGEHDRMYPSDH